MDSEDSFFTVKTNVESSEPPGGSDDEDSFVVLESSPTSISDTYSSMSGEILPPLRTNRVHEMQKVLKMKISQIDSESMPELPSVVSTIDAVASSVAKMAISPESSHEEIQKHVEELIKENETLKNIIAQNNASMKTQYDRFVKYREEVTNVMKSYKDKFNEAKICLDKFKEDNSKLASELEIYINIKKLHEEEILSLKDKMCKMYDPICKDLESSSEDTTVSELQTALGGANFQIAQLSSENGSLQSQITSLQSKIKSFQVMLDETNGSILKLSKANKNLSDNVETLQEELQHKQETIDKLTEKLVTSPKLEEQLHIKQEELNILQFDFTTLKNESSKLRNENEDLRRKLSDISKTSEDLRQAANSVSACECQIKQREAEIIKLTQRLNESTCRETDLTRQIMGLQTRFKELSGKYKPALQEEYDQVRSQLSEAQQTITALETEQEIKSEEIEELRKLIQESQAKTDEIFALREQLTLFKNDFEAEQESKDAMKKEKDRVIEDLQNLQKRNGQLQDEVDKLRARLQPRDEGYACPKCSFKFASYQSLENHVHRCLDLDV